MLNKGQVCNNVANLSLHFFIWYSYDSTYECLWSAWANKFYGVYLGFNMNASRVWLFLLQNDYAIFQLCVNLIHYFYWRIEFWVKIISLSTEEIYMLCFNKKSWVLWALNTIIGLFHCCWVFFGGGGLKGFKMWKKSLVEETLIFSVIRSSSKYFINIHFNIVIK